MAETNSAIRIQVNRHFGMVNGGPAVGPIVIMM